MPFPREAVIKVIHEVVAVKMQQIWLLHFIMRGIVDKVFWPVIFS